MSSWGAAPPAQLQQPQQPGLDGHGLQPQPYQQSPQRPPQPQQSYSAFGGGAFGGGLFFQQHSSPGGGGGGGGGGWDAPHPHQSPPRPSGFPGFGQGSMESPISQQQQPQTFSRDAFEQRFGAPPQQQAQMQQQRPLHAQQAPSFSSLSGMPHQQQQQSGDGQHASAAPVVGRSILSEVMSLMAPQLPSQQPQQQQSAGGPIGFQPSSAQQQQQAPRPFPGQPLRPPLAAAGGVGGGGRAPPPGFNAAPPGFAQPPPQQQVQSQPLHPMQQQSSAGFAAGPPGMNVGLGGSGGGGASANAPFLLPTSSPLPQPLQGESHVQCSLCRVVVLNTPQSLYMHDHSEQHILNDRRHQQQRQQQQQLQMQQQQPQQQQSHGNNDLSPPLSASTPPLSGVAGGGGAGSAVPPALDLNSLQAQLRSFMAAQDEARLRGLPPLVMDPVLLNQLKRMQDFYKPQQPQSQQQQQQQTNGEEQQQQGADGAASSSSASSSSSSSGPSSTASGGHQYASRAALIAAASEVHFRPVGRSGRHGQGGHHGHSRVTVHPGMEQDLRRLLATLEPDPRTFEIRRELQQETQRIVQGAWGTQRCQVRLFGSSVNTLCETNSDVDMCLDILPDPEAETEEARAIDKPAIVEKLAALLSPIMHDILPLPKARVPIVKFTAPAKFGGLRCDIGINNLLACRNSELIRDYMAIDARARDMCLIIKHFAKRRQINDTYRGTLSSYCYVLMVIHYLQSACHVNPPILPCLQSIERNKDTDKPVLIDGFDCWYNTDIERFKGFGQANTQTLGELLIGFFRLYSHEFDFKEMILSVRTGGYLDKKKKVWGQSAKKDRHLICVEDPFDVTHNLGRGCDPAALYEIRGEFMRAFSTLRDGGSILDVCAPVAERFGSRAPKPVLQPAADLNSWPALGAPASSAAGAADVAHAQDSTPKKGSGMRGNKSMR